ncbi:MAG: hypothetical protein ACFB03_09645 [Paracoccaceae bacterium]
MRLVLLCASLLIGACNSTDNYVLLGNSTVSAAAAVSDANAAVQASRRFNCEPISVGGGTGLSTPPPGADLELLQVGLQQIPREYDVYVVVECPEGTPLLLAESGTPATP